MSSIATNTTAVSSSSSSSSSTAIEHDFLSDLPDKESLQLQIEAWTIQHATQSHRPIALVTSGGTAVDLEVNAVRSLENFSTGLRGAVSVEEFLRRGYGVIHLWRRGSASPYARVVSQKLGIKHANHGLDVESLGRLFASEEDKLVKSVLEEERRRDPWLTDESTAMSMDEANEITDDVSLNRGLVYSPEVNQALRERTGVVAEDRLLTVPFRTVEEYLGKLQLCAQVLQDCRSLAIIYLAAAVSDFYVPKSEKPEHKIQSSENSKELVLRLTPVPKTIGLLRSRWAPDAFVVAFKLETDKDILRKKAERSVESYGCHLVIGNLLHTRHNKVWILTPEDQRVKNPVNAKEWEFHEISKPEPSSLDSLESSIMDFVIQSHFEFISWHFHADGSGVKAAQRAHKLLQEKKKRIRRQVFLSQVKSVAMEVAGAAIAVFLSYSINMALQKRLRSS